MIKCVGGSHERNTHLYVVFSLFIFCFWLCRGAAICSTRSIRKECWLNNFAKIIGQIDFYLGILIQTNFFDLVEFFKMGNIAAGNYNLEYLVDRYGR